MTVAVANTFAFVTGSARGSTCGNKHWTSSDKESRSQPQRATTGPRISHMDDDAIRRRKGLGSVLRSAGYRFLFAPHTQIITKKKRKSPCFTLWNNESLQVNARMSRERSRPTSPQARSNFPQPVAPFCHPTIPKSSPYPPAPTASPAS